MAWTLPDTYGSPVILNGSVGREKTGNPARSAYIDVGVADMELSAVVGPNLGQYYNLGARVDQMPNSTTGYLLSMDTCRITYQGASRTPAQTVTAGDTLTMRVKDEEGGTRATAYLNGVKVGTWLNTAPDRPTSTTAGIYIGPSIAYVFDSFEVRQA